MARARTDYTEPETYKQAMNDAYKRFEWELAMGNEYESLMKNQIWVLVIPPPGINILDGKWVYKCKRGADRSIIRYKARWVVRGFQQREGQDFFATFATVIKPISYKALIAIAAAYDLEIEQMDVKTAFLHGNVLEKIYIYQPKGFDDGSGRVCLLNKALYGLKQSPRIWYQFLSKFLEELGYRHIDEDYSVFLNPDTNTIVAMYMDNILIMGANKQAISDLKSRLNERFEMSDLGPCSQYLGMSVTRDRPNRTLYLSQEGYINQVLTQHDMYNDPHSKGNGVAIPMEANTHLGPAPEGFTASKQSRHSYQSAVGSLMYAMMGTRPDIAYAVSVVSRYAANPHDSHWTAVKRIFRYLRGTVSLKLVFRGPLQPLSGYTDSDYIGDPDTRRSTSGYTFNLGSAAIS